MNQASVGFQCPDCLRSSGQRVYTARSLAAAQRPWMTYALIGINVAVYLYGLALGGANGGTTSDRVLADGGLIAGAVRVSGVPQAANHLYESCPTLPSQCHLIGVAHGDWWRIFTSGFLHAGVAHIALNMIALYFLGMLTERFIGWWRFGLLYLVSLVAGSLGSLIVSPNAIGVGASGAIFGLFGVLIVAARANRIDVLRSGIVTWLVLDLVFTFAVPGISIGAHIGGLIGGAVAGILMLEVPRRLRSASGGPNTAVGVVLTLALGAACIAGSLAVASSAAIV
jgi:membrane associated rhomboid family serine protease